jgi:hypothetical protein
MGIKRKKTKSFFEIFLLPRLNNYEERYEKIIFSHKIILDSKIILTFAKIYEKSEFSIKITSNHLY